ncbi:MAG: alpha/beta-hydrolase N-terminal domain-containing protein, partial [Planctomycetota bacterium]
MKDWSKRYWKSFSFVGLVVATLFFSASVTPSLLPRNYLVQGLLSGFAIAMGYGVGICLVVLYEFLQFRRPTERLQKIC